MPVIVYLGLVTVSGIGSSFGVNLVLKKDGQSDSDVPEQVVNGDTGLIVEFSVSKSRLHSHPA